MKGVVLLQEKKEPLIAELEPYLADSPVKGCLAINHPLLIDLCIGPGCFAAVNRRYRLVKQELEEARAARNWGRYFMLIEKPYRLAELSELSGELTDSEYWKHLGEIYTLTEVVCFQEQAVRDLFSSSRPGRENLMNADERKILDSLPEEVTIYRGYDLSNSKGWSWTLDEVKAEWFANRWREANPGRKRRIATGKVRKRDIIAYFDGRNETEIVVNPQHVRVVNTRTVD